MFWCIEVKRPTRALVKENVPLHPAGTSLISVFFEEIKKIEPTFTMVGILDNNQFIYLQNYTAQLYFT